VKAKNIKLYLDKYKYISSDAFTRVKDFIESHKFTKKDREKFHEGISLYLKKKNEETTLKIVFDIIPEPTPRPRLGMGGRFYVKNSSSNNKFVEAVVKTNKELFHIVDGPCSFTLNSYLPIPQSFNKVDTLLAELGILRPSKKPDWDNLGKTYSDAIQPWIISDDAIIVDAESHKYYSMKPRVELIIKYYR